MAKNILNINQPIVLIGLMGAGKSTVGHRLATRLDIPFIDSDVEIEVAAGCSVEDIFELYGESEFRSLEKRVLERLMSDGPMVLATGGGAFLNDDIRALVLQSCTSVWLKASLDTLVSRTSLRGGRPLLKQGDPQKILQKLIDQRYPVYAHASITIDTDAESLGSTVDKIVQSLTNSTGTSP